MNKLISVALAGVLFAGSAGAYESPNVELGLVIANQGDAALVAIRQEARAEVTRSLPALPRLVPVVAPARPAAGGPPPATVRAAK